MSASTSAKPTFGAPARGIANAAFVCGTTDCLDRTHAPEFDIVLGLGLLHHLDDDAAVGLFDTVSSLLKDGGRVVTIDPCFTPRQNPVARYLARRDRGRNVRAGESYAELARPYFAEIATDVRDDLLNVPYTHCIMECRAPKRPR
jgi:hypothetical protein